MTRLWHEDIDLESWTIHQEGAYREIGQILRLPDLRWGEQFTQLFGVDLHTLVEMEVPLGPSVSFIDNRAVCSRNPGDDIMITISSGDTEWSIWTIVIQVKDYPISPTYPIVVIELSGSVDRPEVVTALEALGFHTKF